MGLCGLGVNGSVWVGVGWGEWVWVGEWVGVGEWVCVGWR